MLGHVENRDERERSKARSEGRGRRRPHEASVGHGDAMVRDCLSCPVPFPTLTNEAEEWFQAADANSDDIGCSRSITNVMSQLIPSLRLC